MKKIIIDTNWWVSFILSKHSFGLPDFFLNETIDFYFSNELLQEIKTTLAYTKRKERINTINLEQFFSFIEELAVIVDATSVITICRGRKDNFLLALAKDSGADYLVSNDGDLLTLKKFENTDIVTLPEFIKIINQ